LPLIREDATYRRLFREEMMGSSIYTQKSTDPFARRAEQEGRRDAIAKARGQTEEEEIDAKTMRLRALRMAKEGPTLGPVDQIGGSA